jgi:hypothetical protein
VSLTLQVAAPQYASLRDSGYAGELLVSLFSNRVVFAGQINSDLTTPSTWAAFDYNNVTVGAYADVVDQQCLLIGAVNDIQQATFYGRIRGTPSSSAITCNQSSQDFDVGDYFWVIDNHLPQYRRSRASSFNPLDAVELVDFDETFQRMLPVLVGLQTVYVGYVDPASGKLRLGFDLSASYAADSGKTIASLVYSLNGTLIAGSFSGPICIVDFDPGEQYGIATGTDSDGRTQTRYFGIKAHDAANPPDSGFQGGKIESKIEQGLTFSIPAFQGVDDVLINTTGVVWRSREIYGSTPGSLYGGGSAAITNKALSSQTATLTATGHPYAAGQKVIVADVGAGFDGTFVITATTANTYSYHSAHANVASTPCSGMSVVNPNNVMFVGWLQGEDDPVTGDVNASVIATANFRFTGVGPRLQRLRAQLLPLTNSDTPTIWGEISDLTPWRGILEFMQRYTTVPNNCDITFSDTSSQFSFPDMSTQGGSALAAIQWLGGQIDAVPTFGPAGQIAIDRDITYLSDAERVAQIPNIADWQAQDALSLTRTSDPNKSIGSVSASGAVFNTANGQVSTFVAQAPGIIEDEAAGSSNLAGQILVASADMEAAKRELQARAGAKFKYENLQEFIDAQHPDGYAGIPIIASRSQTYTWTLSEVGGPDNVNRVIYDNSVLFTVDSASYQYDEKIAGYAVDVRYRRVITTGDPGDDLTQYLQAENQTLDPVPDYGYPAFGFDAPELVIPDEGLDLADIAPAQLLPPPGMIASFKGQELITWNANKVYYEKNVINLKRPQSVDITPSNLPAGYHVVQCVVDPAFTNTAIPAYCLITNNTDSQVGYCTNIAAPGASELWTFGDTVTGQYSVIRPTGTAGSILIYSPDEIAAACSNPSDFNSSNWTINAGPDPISGTTPLGTWSTSSIFETVNTGANGPYGIVELLAIPSQTISELHYDMYRSTASVRYLKVILYSGATPVYDSGTLGSPFPTPSVTGAWETLSYTLPSPVANVTHILLQPAIGTGYIQMRNASYCSSTGGNAKVAYSSDYGATIGSPLTVGVFPGNGGFDVQRSGNVSYGAAVSTVGKATTLGGSYSNWYSVPSGIPVCIIIPYFRRNSTTKNTSVSDPDALVATTTGKLYWVDGPTATETDISPPGVTAFSGPNCVTVSYGHHIACYGSVSGTIHLFTSTDGGSTWTDRGARTGPTFIRCRRNDSQASASGSNKGQLYLMDNGNLYYSSVWASTGPFIRTMPVAMTGFDTIW